MCNHMSINIDVHLAKKLVVDQFPQWKNLPIYQVEPGGWDNRSFRLGNSMLIRLPSDKKYANQVIKEQKWLPKLKPLLPVQIPSPLALGSPTTEFPYFWSIYNWIDGKPLEPSLNIDFRQLAKDLACFLIRLQNIDAFSGPSYGPENFYRGGPISHYHSDLVEALILLKDKVETSKALKMFERAMKTKWTQKSLWIHGDISCSNLLVKGSKLHAVIDFGQLGEGDPACDLAIAWTIFNKKERSFFQNCFSYDQTVWQRAQAWALWKAMLYASKISRALNYESKHCFKIIKNILENPC